MTAAPIEDNSRLKIWESILQETLNAQPNAPVQWDFACYNRVGSTMDVAREHVAQAGQLARPLLILAAEQTSGRGRQGRVWHAPQSGFFGTYVFEVPAGLASLGGCSLAFGCVIHDLMTSLHCSVGLKWPNDLLDRDGRKLSGLLIEVINHGGKSYLFAGIGINIAGAPAGETDSVSMQDLSGRSVSPLDIAIWLSLDLYLAWETFCRSGFAGFHQRWTDRAMYVGATLCVDPGNGELLRGKFTGVDEHGCMLLDTGTGIREIASGHVVERLSC